MLGLAAAILAGAVHADSGVMSTLYSFAPPSGITSDGAVPLGSLAIGTDGNYYGVTLGGGFQQKGTLYSLTPTGVETQLYAMWTYYGYGDALGPATTPLLAADGYFYGTSTQGGANDGSGTVFRFNPAGDYEIIHSFSAGVDGARPEVALVQGSDGTLYGTTSGGSSAAFGPYPYGTVYSLSPSGTFNTLYGFSGQADGSYPQSLLMGSDGNLYGVTTGGGAYGAGSLFELSTSGTFQTLYSFGNPATVPGDGAQPSALIQASDGNFYGTTLTGGASGNGTLFRFTADGTESIVHSFAASPDGAYPMTLVQGTNGNLFGTTQGGGLSYAGTLFEVTPQGQASTLVSFSGAPVTSAVPVPENAGNYNFSGGLLPLPDGRFVGTMPFGGAQGQGAVYSLTVSPAAPPPEVRLSASPAYIYLGQSTRLYWSSIGTSGCTASGAWSGSKHTTGMGSFKPTATGDYSFQLTCNTSSGPVTASATLNVSQSPAPTVNISANPATLVLGETTDIAWTTYDATSCTASGNWSGKKGLSGGTLYTPTNAGTKTFSLTCSGLGGSTTASVIVTVFPAKPTVSIRVTPSLINLGQGASLSWSARYATSCTATGSWTGTVPVNGTQTLIPTAPGTYQYEIICTDGPYSANGEAILNVNP